jgi:diguanylate cyclase (GGDEF)-like protein/PAS domain S-box-containing protein
MQEPPAQRDALVLDAVLRTLDEGVILTDAHGRVSEINPAAERLTAWHRDEALGRDYAEVLRLTPVGGGRAVPALSAGDQATAGEWMLQTRDRRRLVVRVRTASVQGVPGFNAIAFSDITEETLLLQDHSFRSTHDPLTGLLNRDEFVRRVRTACATPPRRGCEHVVAVLDIDRLGVANDTFGHAAGDKLLRELAALLRGRMRTADQLARVGGDEFGLLLLDCRPDEGVAVLEGLLQAARNFHFYWGSQSLRITASIGATRVISPAQHEARILSLVDAACSAAKEAGRDRLTILDPRLALTDRTDDLGIAAHLSSALNDERFVLCHQDAVLVTETQKPMYRELLLRLRHEHDELVLPHRFIPAAEHYFLMNAIDRWVTHTAIRHVSAHGDGGLINAVNVSGQSISDKGFLQFVVKTFESNAADPRRFCFEIAENVAVTGLTETAHFMQRLRDLGCRFAIDHFGAGMAAFSYLKNLPVDYVKIEGSLIRGMLDNGMNRSLVEAICRVAHDLGVTTIAEHVESLELLDPLRAIGVDMAQGMAIGPIGLLRK